MRYGRAVGAWLRKAVPAAGAWFRKAGLAVKTGLGAAAQAAGAWLRKAGPAAASGLAAAAQAAGAWLRKAGPAAASDLAAAGRAAGAWLRKAGTGLAAAGRAIGAWLRKTGPAVRTGAVTAGRAAGAWFRKTGSAFRAIPRAGLRTFIKNRLKASFREGIPTDRYRRLAGTGILFAVFIVNIFLLKQPDMAFPFQGITDKTLVFTQWWEHSLNAGILEGLIDEFEKQNPDIRITLDTRSYTEIRELLTGTDDSAGGQNADILGLDPQWFGEAAVTERLEPLSRYYKKGENPGAFYTGAETLYGEWVRGEWVRGEWGRPLVSFMMPLFYNIDLLEAAGFDRPPKNQADFAAFAKAVTGPDRYGFAIALSPE
ncbi:MAG: extracellular solute-binding protein, partial [Treponema sp.]|nr:extracellular solute-binding protein [Treponema sp.]